MAPAATDSDRTVVVTDGDADGSDGVVSVQDLLDQVTQAEYDEFYEFLYAADVESGTELPLYDVLWKHLAFSGEGGLLERLSLYRGLEAQVGDVDRIVYAGTSRRYYDVLRDFADARDVELVVEDDAPETPSLLSRFAGDLIGMTATMVEQLAYSVCRVVQGGSSLAPTAFFPFPDRFDSMRPVIEGAPASEAFTVVVHYYALLSRFLDRADPRTEFPGESTRTFPELAGFDAVGRELATLVGLGGELAGTGPLVDDLSEAVREEVGAPMRYSVRGAFRDALSGNVRPICYGVACKSAFERDAPERVVVGGSSPRERAIMIAAAESGADVFYVPHSIANRYEPLPPVDVTMFVPGEMASDYVTDANAYDSGQGIVPAGRPYLARKYAGNADDVDTDVPDDDVHVVLATQDTVDDVREGFFRTAMAGVEAMADSLPPSTSVRVTVKIHPSESADYYESLIARHEGDGSVSVAVAEGDLDRYLVEGDLLLTINSNVGLEAMLLGTATAAINEWRPVEEVYPFMERGPVPLLESEADVTAFFTDLSPADITDLARDQHAFALESYELDPDVGRTIAEYVFD